MWAADTLKRLRLSAFSLWNFLLLAIQTGNKADALRRLGTGLSVSCAYRLWKRFLYSQSRIRTALTSHGPFPALPRSWQPAEQTAAHLKSAFPSERCPVVSFQQELQIAFL